jgi:predicted RNA-binding protein with PUA-like domain
MRYWLLRSEPDAYSWDDLVRDGATEWNGVRNYTARNFLKEMQPGDQALFYHSNTEKAAVGIMEITRAWQPDGDDGKWASVAVKPRLAKLEVLRQSRLSVTPVRDDEWAVLLELSEA